MYKWLDNEIITKDYHSNMSLSFIGNKYGVSKKCISNRLKKSNIQLKRPSCYRKYYFNERIFRNINTQKKAYWLGYLYADGNVTNTSNKYYCVLSSKDKEHLKKFKKLMEADYKIEEKCNQPGLFRITFGSKNLVNDLINHGVFPNKSNTLKFPNISSKLIKYFILGYFDGDGTLYINYRRKNSEFEICSGSKQFLLEICKYLLSLHLVNKINIYNIKSPYGCAYRIRYSGNIQVYKIMKHLYRYSKIYLDRKHNKFLDLAHYIAKGNFSSKKINRIWQK